MDDFDKKINNDTNDNAGNVEITGFDSVDNTETANNNQGYTMTPDGGFYTKQKDDIIQDETVRASYAAEPESDSAEKAEPEQKTSFFPNGQYGAYSSAQNNQNQFEQGGVGSNGQNQYGQYNYAYRPPVKKPKIKKERNKKYGAGIVTVASLLAAVIGAGSGVAATMLSNKNNTAVIEPSEVSGSNVNINIDETAESVVEAVAKKVTPSVVGIRTTSSVMNFFGGSSEATGEGSGVVYSSDGYIITNYHVISGAIENKSGSKVEVFIDTASSKSYPATVIGYNISSDLAVIKINVKGLTAAEIVDSSKLKVGQYVITVGNPGGLEFMDSVTYGVISGLNRVVSSNSDVPLIQTDAAINPGNSGGALVNTKGQLVGINSSKIVSEEFEGMGFAIPSNTVVKICKKIIEKQNDPEPYIGITISEKYTAEVLKYYGYPSGAVILSVADGSPAATAGLAKGDIITEFADKKITEYSVLDGLINDCTPGKSVNVKIYRSGRYYTTTIAVGSNNAVS